VSRRLTIIGAGLFAVALHACGSLPAPRPPALDEAAERYVRIVLALGERDADSLDSYSGPAAWSADARRARAPLADVQRDARALANDLSARAVVAADEERRAFLVRQLRAVVARIGVLRGDRPRLADEAAQLLGIDVGHGRPIDVRPVYEALARELPGPGDLATRLAAFDRSYLVPRDRLSRVIDRAIGECRSITAAHLPMPTGERVDVRYVADMAWSAHARHDAGFRSRVDINASLPLTIDRALSLACHETYPGHHAMFTLIEQRLGRHVEYLVQPTYSPQSALQESAASGASDLAFDEADRMRFERDVLFPLAGLDPASAPRHVRVSRLVDQLRGEAAVVARQYLDGELDFARASNALRTRALMAAPDTTIMFLNRFRSYAVTYANGRDLFWNRVQAADEGAPDSRWRALVTLVTSPRQTVE
jgi:hypothetical protein